MHFSGSFSVPVDAAVVMQAFGDVERMAGLMPGAFIERREDDGVYSGGMLVAFGPKKILFRGKVRVELDTQGRGGTMIGRGAADIRAARVEMHLRFDVKDIAAQGAAPSALVSLSADTRLGGVLAEFERTGGPVVAKQIMEDFAGRLRNELMANTDVPQLPALTQGAAEQLPSASALRMHRVLWVILCRWLRHLITRRPA